MRDGMGGLRSILASSAVAVAVLWTVPPAGAETDSGIMQELAGTEWHGTAELWVDPSGDQASTSDATLTVDGAGIAYTWAYEGKAQAGRLESVGTGVRWQDTWHQAEPVHCAPTGTGRGLFSVEYAYAAGSGPDWHWRIVLARRPDDTLVLQMTNIAPWGEEARAVRMVLARKE